MNKLLFAAGLLALTISLSMAEDDDSLHSVAKRSAGYPGIVPYSGNAIHPGGVGYPGYYGAYPGNFAAYPGGYGGYSGSYFNYNLGNTIYPGFNSGKSGHVTYPRYFSVPIRYKGFTSKYYEPQFEYASVPSGYRFNTFQVPVRGTFGDKGGFAGRGAFAGRGGFAGRGAFAGRGGFAGRGAFAGRGGSFAGSGAVLGKGAFGGKQKY